jgi:hypothetical protein
MDFLNEYVVLVVLGICLCVGFLMKTAKSEKLNKFIPLSVAVLGVVINVWLNGFAFTPQILLGGLTSGLASTGLHQAFKQFIEKKKENEE